MGSIQSQQVYFFFLRGKYVLPFFLFRTWAAETANSLTDNSLSNQPTMHCSESLHGFLKSLGMYLYALLHSLVCWWNSVRLGNVSGT